MSHPEFIKTIQTNHSDTFMTDEKIEAKLEATFFLTFADPVRFSGLWRDLANSHKVHRDDYPNTRVDTYALLTHYQAESAPKVTSWACQCVICTNQ